MTAISYGEMRTRAERITDGTLKERVLLGLEALKDEYGEDFANHIDPETLDMADASLCVVGQLTSALGDPDDPRLETFDGYLGLAVDDSDLPYYSNHPEADAYWEVCNERWKELDRTWLHVLGAERD